MLSSACGDLGCSSFPSACFAAACDQLLPVCHAATHCKRSLAFKGCVHVTCIVSRPCGFFSHLFRTAHTLPQYSDKASRDFTSGSSIASRFAMHRGPSPETTPLLRRNYCLMCAGFAAACLFIAGLLMSASLKGQAREVRILPVFSSSVAFQKNLRTPSKKFLGTGRAAADSKLLLGRIAPSRTAIVDM